MRAAAAAVTVAMSCFDDRQQRLAAHAGSIRRRQRADRNLLYALEALRHDLHVGLDDALAQSAELLDVLLVHDLVELLLGDAEFAQQRRHREERAEEGVALHAQLKVG